MYSGLERALSFSVVPVLIFGLSRSGAGAILLGGSCHRSDLDAGPYCGVGW
jgi:hypothetical protein